ncbi:Multidrug efflux pump subunit AcrB [Alkalispirochaeta americana]|uniref:Multidrug efflux pump subunit AcrB n=1 Tax=Alkalispirochaeta americana TaxID=159291 RepID=A0A1N6TN87_9SPIO|nr:efflux RND transporter permease subunit [Alkalispirochaeta americana]SIQ54717.1 Multidrug efflux pump subunit AcrB [Alkalispirochaeta americana]
MTLPERSVEHPVTVIVLAALLVGIAATMVPRLAVNLYPDVSPPVISVSTSFPGAGPEDVEQNVTVPLETALAAVTGLDSINSTSSTGSSRITLFFGYDQDLDEAMNEVTSILSTAGNRLPDDAGSPVARRFNLANIPVMQLVLRGDFSLEELRRAAEDRVKPAVESVPGVAAADVSGGGSLEVRVELMKNRLAAYGLTPRAVASALDQQNVLVSGGTLVDNAREFQLRTAEELSSLEEVRRVVVTTLGGGEVGRARLVRVEDVAEVRLASSDETTRVFVNGEPGVFLRVQNSSDSNAVRVSDSVRERVASLEGDLPPGMSLEVLSDNTALIRATLNQVYASAFQGALLAMAVLFIFLRNVRGTLIIGLSLPLSVLITLMAMAVFGLTLNLLTLTGLIMGLGMVVDGSIVILENIHNYRERGTKAVVAAVLGSQEMYRAIVASTATTLGVFVPVLLFRNDLGFMGYFFTDLVFTVAISLVVSLVVAVSVVPALAGALLPLNTRVQKPLRLAPLRAADLLVEGFFCRLERGYGRALRYGLDHRFLVLLLVTLVTIFSFRQFGDVGINLFVRSRTDDTVFFSLQMPLGTPLEETEGILRGLGEELERRVQGWNNIVITAGSGRRWGGSSASHLGSIQITLPPPAEQIDTPESITRLVMPLVADIPGVNLTAQAGRRAGTSAAVSVEIRAESADLAVETALEARRIILEHLPQVEDLELSLEQGGPELAFRIDRERAAALGVSVPALAQEIRSAYGGNRATTMKDEGTLRDVVIILQESDREDRQSLDSLYVSGAGGALIPLSSLATIIQGRAPTSIERQDRRRVVTVTGDLPAGVAATDFQPLLQETLDRHLIPPGEVQIFYGGEAQDIDEFSRTFGFIILTAVLLVFGIMASQFESFLDPLVIFFSIPLLFVGVIWIYRITGQPFSLFAAVGVVALVGIVVNNGIVLVDYTNTLRARGLPVREATLAAGQNRLRPILMTSLTTILGMVPLAFFPGEGSETIQPIGQTIVGGLSVASVMTLFVTPLIYSLLNGWRDWKPRGPLIGKYPADLHPEEHQEDSREDYPDDDPVWRNAQ